MAPAPVGGEDRGARGGETRQEHADGHHGPRYQVTAVEADRTLGDTTPTGIGLKPDGDQLRDMESDRLARADRFRRNVHERVEDIQDVTEKTAGHADTRPAIASSPPPADAGALDPAHSPRRRATTDLRRPEGSTP